MKKSGLKKSSKPKRITTSQAKKKAWTAFSRYIRLRDAIRTTGTTTHAACCSCGKVYPAFGVGCVQAGHFIPGRRNAILFDERGVHAQCYICNVRFKGNWTGYYSFMLSRYGQAVIDDMIRKEKQIKQFMVHELLELADTYTSKADALEGNHV
jgi:hypothetical protein